MKIIVFGANGQLGQALQQAARPENEAVFVTRDQCDLAVAGQVEALLDKQQPTLVINAAAYTAVDQAEEDPALAHAVNADAVGEMARYAKASGARLIHLSTDFVFDGRKTSPYLPGDQTGPLGEYGESKLAGELAALSQAPESTMIIRTAWVYSHTGKNFVNTMLRLMKERDELGVVADQRGAPTYAQGLADLIWQVVELDLLTPGIFHWTDQGNITWHEFAVAIQEEALVLGLLDKAASINAISTDQYPTPAARPAFSVLDCTKLENLTGIGRIPWRENLRAMLSRL